MYLEDDEDDLEDFVDTLNIILEEYGKEEFQQIKFYTQGGGGGSSGNPNNGNTFEISDNQSNNYSMRSENVKPVVQQEK